MRYVALDGLRGVAAMVVLLYHALGETFGITPLRGGYLAVDFFFMLSGFVIARAYEQKMPTGLVPFMRARARRLYPTIATGIIVGGIAALLSGSDPMITLALTVAGLLFVPVLDDHGWGIFPINGPQWSLFFEVIANLIHGALLWRLSVRGLAIIAGISFLLLCAMSEAAGSMAFGHIGNRFLAGLPRVLFSYTIGIILFRMLDQLPAIRCPAWALFVSLPVLLTLSGLSTHWAAGPLTVLVFPAIVIAGLSVHLSAREARICEWLGALSYPLYAVHRPAITLAALAVSAGLAWKLAAALAVSIVLGWAVTLVLEPKGALSPIRLRREPSAGSPSKLAP